ncbi:MAG: glycosyltransferase family 1 protein [Verrucomicrobia bacterium]|nr:glycosyltransferase family 1 protein [Verrucomicrobiota bacterium]
MRLLVASSNRGTNGAVVYAERLIPMLRSAGHDVWLAAEPESWIVQKLAGQVPVILTDFRRFPLDEVDRVARFCRRERIDLVHSHLTRSSNFAAVLRQFHGIRSVAHLHASQPRLHTAFHDQLVAVSEDVARRQARFPWNWTASITVLTNCVDAGRFRPAEAGAPDPLRAALGVGPDTPVVVVVGLVCDRKGQDLGVRAFAALRRKHPGAVLAVVGDGEFPAGLPMEGVRRLGFRDDVHALLPHASAVIVPSREEPFGLAAIEAMACGVPVVAFAVGGLREVVSGGAGVAVRPGDCEAMGGALAGLLADPSRTREQAEAGRRAVLARYAPAAHVEQLGAIFARAMD